MIRPDQVRQPGSKSADHDAQLSALENACDSAIRHADQTQNWPARVSSLRMRLSAEAIAETKAKYEAAGWRVVGAFDSIFHIHRPEVKP